MDTFQVLLSPSLYQFFFVTKINSKKAVQACIIVKDWDNYDNLEFTVTQVDHIMIDTRWEQKWTLKIMGLRMAVDGLWITGSEV